MDEDQISALMPTVSKEQTHKLEGNYFSKSPEMSIQDTLNEIKESDEIGCVRMLGHVREISAVEFIVDKKILITGSEDSSLRIWDIKSATEFYTLKGHNKKVTHLKYSDNKLFSSSEDCTIIIWDFENKIIIKTLRDQSFPIIFISLSPSNNLLASYSTNQEICIYDCSSFSPSKFKISHSAQVTGILFSQGENYLISSSLDSFIKFWNIFNKTEELSISIHTNPIIGIVQYGKYILSAEDNLIKFWDQEEKHEEFSLCKYSNITAIANYEETLVLNLGKKLVFWNINDQREEFYIKQTENIFGVWISPERKYVVSCNNEDALLWEIFSKQEEAVFEKHSESVSCLAINNDENMLYSGSWDGTICIWDLNKKICLESIFGAHSSGISCLALSRNGSFIATGSADKTVKLWNLLTNLLIHTFDQYLKPLTSLDFSPNSQLLATACKKDSIKIWNIENKWKELEIDTEKHSVYCVKFSLDGIFIFYAVFNKLIIWNIENKCVLKELVGHTGQILALALDPNDKIASGSMDKTIKIWSNDRNAEKTTFKGHTDSVSSLYFINDHTLLSTSWDCTAKIWNLREKRLEINLKSHKEKIFSGICTKNEDTIFTASADCSIKIWKLFGKNSEFSRNRVALSLDGKILYTSSKNSEIFKLNIEKNKESRVVPSSQIHIIQDFVYLRPAGSVKDPYFQDFFSFYNIFMAFKCNIYESLTSKNSNVLISKFGFTQLHFLAFTGKFDEIKKLLTSDCSIHADVFGHSALYYSIVNKNSKCTKLLLEYLIEISNVKGYDEIVPDFHAIRNDIVAILRDSPSCINEFFEAMLKSPFNYGFVGTLKQKMPIVLFTSSEIPNNNDFEASTEIKNTSEKSRSSAYELFSTLIPFPDIEGSAISIYYLESLLECQNIQILKNSLICYYIMNKWNKLIWYSILIALLKFIDLLLVLILLIYPHFFTIPVYAVLIFFNFPLLYWEFKKMILLKKSYYSNPWNIVDFIKSLTLLIWIIINLSGKKNIEFSCIMGSVNFIRGLTAFKVVDGTRYYIWLIFRALNDFKFFLVIFFYSTFCFGVLFYIAFEVEEANFNNLWIEPFKVTFSASNYNANEFGVKYLGLFFASIINVIIMLNVLISILGDSYDQFQTEKLIIDIKSRTEQVLEIEKMLFWRYSTNTVKNMHICDAPQKSSEFDSWEGKLAYIDKTLKKIDQKVAESSESSLNHLSELETKLQNLENSFSHRFNFLEELIKQRQKSTEVQIQDLNEKMSKLIEHLISK